MANQAHTQTPCSLPGRHADGLRAFFADFDRLDLQAGDLHLPGAAPEPPKDRHYVRYFGDYELLEATWEQRRQLLERQLTPADSSKMIAHVAKDRNSWQRCDAKEWGPRSAETVARSRRP
jgi:hypothetical protein